jgi:hypothetical protein
MKKYSPSKNAFYDTDINEYIPDDAVDITEKEWIDLLDGQANGKAIICGPDHLPCLGEQLAPTVAELIALAESKRNTLRAEADAAIQPLQDAADLDMATKEEANHLIAWKKYRVMLMRVNTDDPDNIDWPEKTS